MRLGAKIFAACTLVILALVGVAGWSLLAVGQLVHAHREIIDRSLPALQLEAALRETVPRLRRLEARHLALTEDAYRDLLAEQRARAGADLERLGALVTSTAEREPHRRAVSAFRAYRGHLEDAQALLAQGKRAEALRRSDGPARAAVTELDQALSQLGAATSVELARAQAAVIALGRRTWITVLVTLGASVLGALAVTGLVALRLTRSLRRLSAATAQVAEGRFADPLPVATADEVGDLTRSFNRMAERLQEVEAQKRQFFAHVSHELRNPLTAIRSASQLLLARADGALDGKQRRWLELMDGSVDRLLAMVNEILDWNRLQAGVFPLEPRPVGLDTVVAQALGLLRPHAEQQGLAVIETRRGEDFALVADEEALHRIVANLVGNALKFTPAGGSVAIAVTDAGDAVELSVQDDGPGIPAADAARIFEPYQQAHRGRNGSGLGLALVRELVGAHGGTVSVHSEPGQGACFTVRLPRRCPAGEEAQVA